MICWGFSKTDPDVTLLYGTLPGGPQTRLVVKPTKVEPISTGSPPSANAGSPVGDPTGR